MFTITKNRSFTWPIRVLSPESGERREIGEFNAYFRLLDLAETNALGAQGDTAFLSAILVGWDGVVQEDGLAYPYTPEHLATLIDFIPVRAALLNAYHVAISGGAREKN
ncbi:MAG: hypothetical protein HQL97_04510 [Magnetococcales bacterium]|nr:hypothetical protein [Magnetococcales bacterium]